ncbi:MAG: NUDIX domain-containing protein [Verrucomicrobia bacterium]|nr:MAG: NUDIX domain-containing protein [Verrucomicrobiota bacterium]
MFQNLIFDWSGTLVDDLGPVLEATNHVLSIYGLPAMDREQFRRRFRLPYMDFYAEVLPDIPLAELESHFRPAFDQALTPVTILPHAAEKLAWCSALGIRSFVLTSMDTIAFERQLHDFGLAHHFEATYSGVLDKREVIHQIIAHHHLDPKKTAFVGDMTHDVETARHGGVSSIAVLTGYNHAEVLAAARPDLTVPDLKVLKDLWSLRLDQHRPTVTVGALLYNDHAEILLVKTPKWKNLWGIPGGKIERGETMLHALQREMLEETGIEIDRVQFVLAQDSIDSPQFMRSQHFVLLNYLAHAQSTEVVLNHEATEYRWINLLDAYDLPLNEATKFLLDHIQHHSLLPTPDA